MENEYLVCEKPQNEYLNNLKNLLTNINAAKKNKNFTKEVAENLICYKLAELGLKTAKFELIDKKRNIIGSQHGDVFSFNERLMKFNLKNMVTLINCILHEFSHKRIELNNAQIKKDQFGNTNSEYIPKFYEEYVYLVLHWACGIELERASEISFALYSFDKNEQIANENAFNESTKLLTCCLNDANKKLIYKMIKTEQQNYEKFKTQHLTQRNKLLIEEFNYYYKDKLISFQLEFAKNPTSTPLEMSKIYIARMLCPSVEADQKLFNHFLKKEDTAACIKIMNAPDFKNTPKNLADLVVLMQKSNEPLNKLTAIDNQTLKKFAYIKKGEQTTNSNQKETPSFETEDIHRI